MMIKQNIFFLTLLLGSLLTGGCVSTVDEPAADAAPISFATTMTRAAVDTDKKDMECFLVWGGFDSQNNLFNAETVTPQGYYDGTRYWVQGKKHDFYALHPASLKDKASCTEGGVITVTDFDTSQKRGTEAIDLMIASRTSIQYNAGETPSSVDLTFSHELSRVRFTISTAAKVSITDVKLWGVAYKGYFTSNSATPWSNLIEATKDDTPFSQPVAFELDVDNSRHLLAGAYDANNDKYGDLLLIPQDITEDVIFMMTWVYENATSRTVNVPLSQVGPALWEKEKSYHYQATIPSPTTDITFNVTVTDWNDTRIDAEL